MKRTSVILVLVVLEALLVSCTAQVPPAFSETKGAGQQLTTRSVGGGISARVRSNDDSAEGAEHGLNDSTMGTQDQSTGENGSVVSGAGAATGPAVTIPPAVKKLIKTRPAAVKIKKSIHKKVKLRWKRVRGAKVYEVYRSKNKYSGYKLIKTVRRKIITDKKAKQRRYFFYKIRAGRRFNNELYFSKLSKPVKVFVEPEKPRTVIVGECFAVALELEKNNFPSYYRYVAKAGMSTYSILESNEFNYNGNDVTALEKAATYKPDRLIFIVGANYSASIDPEASAAKFVTMKKLMKKINPNIKIVIMGVSPWKKDSKYGVRLASHEKRHQINAAYRNVAEKHKNMYYCNLTEHFEGSDGDLLGQYNGGDGLHWSYYARTWMVQHLKIWLKKMFGNF